MFKPRHNQNALKEELPDFGDKVLDALIDRLVVPSSRDVWRAFLFNTASPICRLA
ncbi:hypothetical protein X737_22365 [Mesorhizobium sp. L48C026A00]|nr:hypothetical protein X737_22365 [Mesorhizobium sp. L48C026A00]